MKRGHTAAGLMLEELRDEYAERFILGEQSAPIRRCEGCDLEFHLVWEVPNFTRYPWTGEGQDPNRDRLFCFDCAEEHCEYWSDMWADYYSAVL